MKITYEIIEKNLATFKEAKKQFPIIQKYIDGEVNSQALNSVGLHRFGAFYEFLKGCELTSQTPVIKGMTWRKLKPILVENCTSERFKTYLKNRTENQFIEILKDPDKYDKLLNGRWIRRPSGRRSGRRSDAKVSSFKTHSIAIVNYIIQKELDIIDISVISDTLWYSRETLNMENSFTREMQITESLMKGIVGVIEESKIDFKKLNLEYISNFINTKLSNLMSIEKGTSFKCIKDVVSNFNPTFKYLKEGTYYTVESSQVRSGLLHVLVVTEQGRTEWHPFTNFEDVSFNRNSILDSLFGE